MEIEKCTFHPHVLFHMLSSPHARGNYPPIHRLLYLTILGGGSGGEAVPDWGLRHKDLELPSIDRHDDIAR